MASIRSESPAAAPPSYPARPVNLFALSFFWFPINLFWTLMLVYFLQSRVEHLVGSEQKGSYLTIISILGGIATTAVQLFFGPISDHSGSRWGRRRPFILWGTLASLGFILGFALAENFWLLVASWFGIQIFLNIANGAYQPLMPDNVPPARHGIASAYMGFALLAGQLLGALTLKFLLPVVGTVGVLLGAIGLLVAGMVVTVVFVPDAPTPPEERKPWREAITTMQDIGITRFPNFYGLLYSRFFINLAYYTVVDFLLFYLEDSIGPKSEAGGNNGLVLLAATVAGLIGTLIIGRFADHASKKTIIYIASAIIGAAALFFGFSQNMNTVLVLAFLFGLGWGAFQAVDWALASNLLPEGGAAKYMAIWHACMTLPQIVAPAAGLYADAINRQYGHGMGWRVVMLSTVVYILVGTALLHRVREKPIADGDAVAA